MIILDTNVISELMKASPMLKVISWLDLQEATQLFITSITVAEISYGLSVLPDGNRKRLIEDAFNKSLNEAFKHRILSFDENAAHSYGNIMGHRKLLGRPMSIPDGQIAAIVLAHNFSIATRNVRDFEECGIGIINPFD